MDKKKGYLPNGQVEQDGVEYGAEKNPTQGDEGTQLGHSVTVGKSGEVIDRDLMTHQTDATDAKGGPSPS